jgi:hypothetical protein
MAFGPLVPSAPVNDGAHDIEAVALRFRPFCPAGNNQDTRQNWIKTMARAKQWVRTIRAARPPMVDEAEKRAIIAACEAFIANILKPRFMPRITPTQWNYVIDIHGAWAAGRYRFMQRYRSGMEDNCGEEFDAPFARIDRMGPDRFDIHWMRHTGKWWKLYSDVTLAEALHILETDGTLHPY